MACVLTTAAGSDIGIGAIQSIRKSSHEIIAVDMDPHGAGLYMADHGVSVPSADHEEWPTSMAQVVKEYNVDVIIPLIDQELEEIDRLQSVLSEDTHIITPRQKLIKKTIDKKEMYEWFAQHGLRTPETTVLDDSDRLSELSEHEFPKIIKPRQGQGGEGIHVFHTSNDLQNYLNSSDIDENNYLIQNFIGGTEFTSNITVSRDNRLLSIVTKEVPERDGYTALGITRNNSIVRKACMEVFESLNPAGPINIQHVIDADGVPRLIEINPRFSGSSCLTVEAGVNEFDLLIRDALGEEVEPITEYETDLSIIRYTDQVYVKERNLLSQKNER